MVAGVGESVAQGVVGVVDAFEGWRYDGWIAACSYVSVDLVGVENGWVSEASVCDVLGSVEAVGLYQGSLACHVEVGAAFCEFLCG